jgi:hypothetical protein
MSTNIIVRFPPRRAMCVWLTREGPAWLVLARGHGWLHGCYESALTDARWLAQNLGFTIRILP